MYWQWQLLGGFKGGDLGKFDLGDDRQRGGEGVCERERGGGFWSLSWISGWMDLGWRHSLWLS